jgi:hypothetical protein
MDSISVQPAVDEFLQQWAETPEQTRKAFLELRQHLLQKERMSFEFVARPGVSYSLRARHLHQSRRPLFAMVDVIDDDPAHRWLSVCFFGEMISDPDERGDFVPEGLLGEDAHCFDIDAWDDALMAYVMARLDEAYGQAAAEKGA